MTQCTIKVEFNELSKSVTANTKIELTNDVISLTDIKELEVEALRIGKELFDSAYAYSKIKTMEK